MRTSRVIDTIKNDLSDMPTDPKKRAVWFIEVFGNTVKNHIDHLKRFSLLPNTEAWLSLISISEDENIKVQYGKLIIEIPYNTDILKQSDWMNNFDIIVDKIYITLDTGISSIPDIRQQASSAVGRFIDIALPPIPQKEKWRPNLSTRCVPKRIIRIQPKNK